MCCSSSSVSSASSSHCAEWLRLEPRSSPRRRASPQVIQLENVSKGYGGQTLFRDVDWRIGDGERIGLVGLNGAGQTTLCRILAGIEEPDEGRGSRPRRTTPRYLPPEGTPRGHRGTAPA